MRGAFGALLIALTWCLASDLSAQGLELGIHAGVNVAGTPTFSQIASEARNGVILGASASFDIAPPIRLQVEAQYVQRGIQFTDRSTTSLPSGMPSDVYKLSYFELPVNLRVGFGSTFRVYALAGTNVGTLLAATRQLNHTDGGSEQTDAKEDINPMSFALELGGGASYAITPRMAVVADARYSYALNQTTESSQPESLLNQSAWKARELKITTGLLFHL